MAAGPRGRSRRPVVTLIALLAALLLGGAASAAYLFYFRPVAEAVAGATGQVVPRPVVESSEPGQPDAPGSSAAAKTAPVPTPPSLTGNTPVNVLLLGPD